MSNFLDWERLNEEINPPNTVHRLSFNDVKDKFKKVAFDVYKAKDGSEKLWVLQSDEDGSEYLYAMYDEAENDIVIESENKDSVLTNTADFIPFFDNTFVKSADSGKFEKWSAIPDSSKENITLSYKQIPVFKFSSKEFGFSSNDADLFASFVVKKIADKTFLNSMLNTMPDKKRVAILTLISEGDAPNVR